ncbi:MAG: 50S ribosomal protein L22 [Proteobacteria bacterium]|nr:50S ribosomal protein L22 [Pseudomonadota bacterium]
MSKPNSPRLVAANEAFAALRDTKGSYTKAQLVMDLIRGKPVERALNELTFCRKKQAPVVKKVLQSAIANAEHNHGLNVDKLIVAQAYADKGMVFKRWHARARGRAGAILKPRCHLTVVVSEAAPKVEKKAAAPKAAKASKPATTAKAEAKPEQATEKTEA